MRPKVIPGYDAHENSHPALYEGNHRDYHFSILPFLMPFSLQYLMNTPRGILYKALKLSIPSSESTK